MTKTYVYRLWDAQKELLYVGISKSLMTRIDQHAKGKSWADEIDSVTAKAYASRDAARAAEIQAIRSENPKHNIMDRAPLNHLVASREQWDSMNDEEKNESVQTLKRMAMAIMACSINPDKTERWSVKDGQTARMLACIARELEHGVPPDVAIDEFFSAGLGVAK